MQPLRACLYVATPSATHGPATSGAAKHDPSSGHHARAAMTMWRIYRTKSLSPRTGSIRLSAARSTLGSVEREFIQKTLEAAAIIARAAEIPRRFDAPVP